MRLALVHPYSWPDVRRGGERYLDDLAWYLATAGHEVDVVTGTDAGAGVVRRADGVTVHRRRHLFPDRLQRLGVSRVDTFGAAAWPVLARRRYDAVHAFTPSAAIAARLARQRVVYSVLGHPTPDQFGVRPGDRALVQRAIAMASVPVALSDASAAAGRAMFGRDLGVLSPGVRTDRFRPDDERARRAPRAGRRRRRPRVLFSGDAGDPRKGLAVVLDAFERVRASRPHAVLALSGPGDAAVAVARFGAAVEAMGVGPLDDVAARYRAATITVLPSRHEAFGLALLESLACGTPVVCCDDGGMPAIVGPPDLGCGRIVPPGDATALAGAIDDVIDLAGRADTATRCVARARQWDWSTVVGPRHVETYQSLLAR